MVQFFLGFAKETRIIVSLLPLHQTLSLFTDFSLFHARSFIVTLYASPFVYSSENFLRRSLTGFNRNFVQQSVLEMCSRTVPDVVWTQFRFIIGNENFPFITYCDLIFNGDCLQRTLQKKKTRKLFAEFRKWRCLITVVVEFFGSCEHLYSCLRSNYIQVTFRKWQR